MQWREKNLLLATPPIRHSERSASAQPKNPKRLHHPPSLEPYRPRMRLNRLHKIYAFHNTIYAHPVTVARSNFRSLVSRIITLVYEHPIIVLPVSIADVVSFTEVERPPYFFRYAKDPGCPHIQPLRCGMQDVGSPSLPRQSHQAYPLPRQHHPHHTRLI